MTNNSHHKLSLLPRYDVVAVATTANSRGGIIVWCCLEDFWVGHGGGGTAWCLLSWKLQRWTDFGQKLQLFPSQWLTDSGEFMGYDVMTKIDGKWFSEPLSCVLGLSSLHSSINQIKSKLVIDTSTADQQCWARPAQDRTQIRPHILVPSLPAFLRPTHTREIVPAASPLIEFRDWIVNLENWKPSFWLFSPGHRPGGIRCSGSSTLVLTSWHQSGFESPSPPNIRTSGHQPRFLIALVTAALPPLPLGRAADMKI